MQFGSYNLNKNLVNVLKELGYVDATPIQDACLPKALKGKSLICKSETGSGKTHAFLIPTINQIDPNINKIQAIIVSPTIELAGQTYEFCKKITDKLGNISCKLISSLTDKKDELESLIYGNEVPEILIGTTFRLHDVILKNRSVDVTGIKIFILDECDMLLDEAYINQIKELITYLKPKQRMIFTATMKNHLISETYKFIGADEIVEVGKNVKVNEGVKHHLVNIRHKDKVDQLINFINIVHPYFTLIFASQKTEVKKVYKELNNRGIKCALFDGDMEVRDRKIMMKRIRNGEFNLVVCSDIASRGIDLDNVSTVISLDLPVDLDYYYHRAGRTGRNGKRGDSYIFYNDEDKKTIDKLIEKSKISFDSLILKEDSLKKIEKPKESKSLKKNEVLDKEIRIAVSKVRSDKVKPGYKKKIKDAVKKAKLDHKKKIIKKNIKEQKKINAAQGGYGMREK